MMNRHISIRKALALAFSACVCSCISPATFAIDYYYDNLAGAGFGSAGGTWGSSSVVSTDATGTAAAANTATTTADTLNLGTSTLGLGNGTISVVAGGRSIGSIIRGSASSSGIITIQSNTITFAANGIVTNNATGTTLTISSTIAGGGTSMTFTGANITGTNSYAGASILNGTHRIDGIANGGANSELGSSSSAASNLVFEDGAILRYDGGTGSTDRNFTINGTSATIYARGSGNLTWNGAPSYATANQATTLTLLSSDQVNGGGVFGGTLADNGIGQLSLVKSGTSQSASSAWSLNAANTFTGSTTVSAGILTIGVANALRTSYIDTTNSITGTTTDGLRLGTGSALNIGGLTGSKNLNNIFNTTSGTYSSVGSITMNVDAANTLSYSGAIANGTGNTTLTKTGAGTQTLSGDNTYTGATVVNGGTLNITGNRSLAATSGGALTVGGGTLGLAGNHRTTGDITIGNANGVGVMNQTAGTLMITSGNAVLLGNNASNTGTYNLSGGTLQVTYTSATRGVMIGTNTAAGTFNLSGSGDLDLTNAALLVGRSDGNNSSGADATFNQTGGSATIGNLLIGGQTPATNPDITADVNLSGGTFTATNFLALAGGNNSVSTINISGTADVTLPAFPTARGTNATATITFDGGTLRNAGASGSYLGGLTNAFIKAGGAKFNTTNGDITISQNLLTHGSSLNGGLTKEGANTLTLTGNSTYTGPTSITAGTLLVNGTHTDGGIYTVGDGTGTDTLGGSGTINANVNIAALGGVLSPGISPGILTINGNVSIAGNLTSELAGATVGTGYDQLRMQSTGSYSVTLGGTLTPQFSGSGWATPTTQLWIVNNESTGNLINTFSNYPTNGQLVAIYDSQPWYIYYGANFDTLSTSGGNDVLLTPFAVPEPGSLIMMAFGMISLWVFRRTK